jgi:hypothetical protein
MGRSKEKHSKEEALIIYRDLKIKFVMDFMNLYNESPNNTRQMLHENFGNEELIAIDHMVRNMS